MKKYISIILAVVLMVTFATTFTLSASANTFVQYKDFYYEKLFYGNTYAAKPSKYLGSDTSITIPAAMHDWEVIGINALFLKDNDFVEEVNLPPTIQVIEKFAFQNCYALKSIDIPVNTSFIDLYAFWNCRSMESFTISSKVLKTIPTGCFSGCSSLKEIVIPEGIEKIDLQAFTNCTSAKYLSIPDSTKIVEPYAFVGCTGFEKIDIGENVTNLNFFVDQKTKEPFLNSNLQSITIGKSVNEIPENLFTNCSDDLIIYGYENTFAEEYSNTHSLKFITLDPSGEIPTTEEPTTEPTTEPEDIYLLGDANLDGNINIKDTTSVQQAIAEIIVFTDIQKIVSDVNKDNSINVKDATLIQLYIAEIIITDGIGKPVAVS